MPTPTVVVHGGTGSGGREAELTGVERAADLGADRLAETGSAVDAVEAAVNDLESDPAFNAGIGSKLQHDGVARPEAAIMTSDLAAGAATGLRRVVNPVSVARDVMERTNAVHLASPFAVRLARHWGHELGSLRTDRREREWAETFGDAPADLDALLSWLREHDDPAGGTVGCVAVDADGRLCAGTSTGGRTHQLRSRVGDTPQIGAGTYCTDRVAVSATGRGESILVTCLARRIAESHGDHAEPVAAALAHLGDVAPGVAGAISVTASGDVAVDHTSSSMAWHVTAVGD